MISPAFALFFSVVFFLYWGPARQSAGKQNNVLLFASLFFYGWIDGRFLGLMLGVILITYFAGRQFSNKAAGSRRLLLLATIFLQLGVLACFKYFHFFLLPAGPGIRSDAEIAGTPVITAFLLPLGISFYLFQAIGYIIDVYRGDSPACDDPVSFAVYLCYFPKITAGPIERPGSFLKQLNVNRIFHYPLAVEGARQVLWGLFVKLVVADNCAFISAPVLKNHNLYSGSTLLTAAFFYAFEVYGDFSGYSNIAIGLSKMLGLRLTTNFAAPFFAANIREFWSRWHISLTAWMTDYVYTPLNFTLRKWRRTGVIIATAITFILIGAWHGANATFILFGMIHAFYFSVYILSGAGSKKKPDTAAARLAKILTTFALVTMALIAFGAGTVADAGAIWSSIFSRSALEPVRLPDYFTPFKVTGTCCCILFLLACDHWQQRQKEPFQMPGIQRPAFRMLVYVLLTGAILLLGATVHVEFIYAQF